MLWEQQLKNVELVQVIALHVIMIHCLYAINAMMSIGWVQISYYVGLFHVVQDFLMQRQQNKI